MCAGRELLERMHLFGDACETLATQHEEDNLARATIRLQRQPDFSDVPIPNAHDIGSNFQDFTRRRQADGRV